MSDTIQIISNNQISPVFAKANSFLLSKYAAQLSDLDNYAAKKEFIVQRWRDEFGAVLIPDDQHKFIAIQFFNHKLKFIFDVKFCQ